MNLVEKKEKINEIICRAYQEQRGMEITDICSYSYARKILACCDEDVRNSVAINMDGSGNYFLKLK